MSITGVKAVLLALILATNILAINTSALAESNDPLESINRKIFIFNDTADKYVLKPMAKGYEVITPGPIGDGISNVFGNLRDVITIVNDVLQFKFVDAASDTGRVIVNSTIGIGGIFDVASAMGLDKNQEDFGQTLGKWGVGQGPYLMVPFFGPYTIRSGVGALVDGQVDVVVTEIDHVPTRNSTWAFRTIVDRADLLAAEELITGDRYTFIRDAYMQRRQAAAIDGTVEDNFGDEDFDEDLEF